MTIARIRRVIYQVFTRLHTKLLISTGGRPSSLGRVRCLVLQTVGRRSGIQRSVVLAYLADGESFIVLGSNYGQEHPPAWWINLQTEPQAIVHHCGKTIGVTASLVAEPERSGMVERVRENNKQWRSYVATVERTLPIIRLSPNGN